MNYLQEVAASGVRKARYNIITKPENLPKTFLVEHYGTQISVPCYNLVEQFIILITLTNEKDKQNSVNASHHIDQKTRTIS